MLAAEFNVLVCNVVCEGLGAVTDTALLALLVATTLVIVAFNVAI